MDKGLLDAITRLTSAIENLTAAIHRESAAQQRVSQTEVQTESDGLNSKRETMKEVFSQNYGKKIGLTTDELRLLNRLSHYIISRSEIRGDGIEKMSREEFSRWYLNENEPKFRNIGPKSIQLLFRLLDLN